MSQKHHGRALEMNRKEVGGSKTNPSRTDSRRGCGLRADLCASPGVGGLVRVSGLIKTPGLGSMELGRVCAAQTQSAWAGLGSSPGSVRNSGVPCPSCSKRVQASASLAGSGLRDEV